MKNKDSATHDMSSPKHSYMERRKASATQANGTPTPTALPQVKRVIVAEERETFDVPHMQYF